MQAEVLLAWLLLALSPLAAQQPPPGGGDELRLRRHNEEMRHALAQQPGGADPLGEVLFPPELVMRHQQAIGLKPEQKAYLRDEIRKAQLRFTELQWQLEDAMESLRSLLEQSPTAEAQVLAQLDKVLEAEREIKRTQLTLMIRIKNKLTPEQQARLRELRPKTPAPPALLPPGAPLAPPGFGAPPVPPVPPAPLTPATLPKG